jgi:hypothetical protein
MGSIKMPTKKNPTTPSLKGAPDPEQSAASVQESPAPAPAEPAIGHEYAWDEVGEGLVFTEEDLADSVGHSETRTLKRTNARQPSSWVQGPGAFSVLIEGIKLLKGAAKAAGKPMSEIKAVIVKALPKHDVVLVAPAKEGAPGAIPARRKGKGPLKFTASEILLDAGMAVTSGYRELYPVKKVASSPIGPCVAISMVKPIVARKVGGKKEEEE